MKCSHCDKTALKHYDLCSDCMHYEIKSTMYDLILKSKMCVLEVITPVAGFEKGERVLSLGEIENMKGHIAFVDTNRKVFWGFHPEHFRLLGDDDV